MKRTKKKKSSLSGMEHFHYIERQKDVALEFIKSRRGRILFQWVFQIAVVLAMAAVVAIFFFQSIGMQESSMEPTLQTGERFFINRVAYKMGSPKRGDIIAFTKDGKEGAAIHIKRVIGLPGETVQIQDGKVYIDGERLEDDYETTEITDVGIVDKEIELAGDEFFVLGDDRQNSEDSRMADIGNVKRSYIYGKVWFVISPGNNFGFVRS